MHWRISIEFSFITMKYQMWKPRLVFSRAHFPITLRHVHEGKGNLYLFDRLLKQRQKQWALDLPDTKYYDYIRKEATDRLADRLDDISRTFPLALEIDAHHSYFEDILNQSLLERDGHAIGGIKSLIQTKSLKLPGKELSQLRKNLNVDESIAVHEVYCDEEDLPFPPQSFDLVISPFSLHWINDLPKSLQQIKSILKPDGVFLGEIVMN